MKKSKISPELHALYKIVADPNATHAEKLAAIGAQGDVIRGTNAEYPDTGNGAEPVPTGQPEVAAIQGTKVPYPDLGGTPAAAPSDGRVPAVNRGQRAPTIRTIAARPAAVAPVAVAEPVHRGGILRALGIRQGPFIGKGLNSPDAPMEVLPVPVASPVGGPTPEALSLIAAAKKSHAARQPVNLIYDDKSDAMMTPADIIHRQATERAKPQPVAMFAEGDDIRTPEEQLLYARGKGATTMSPAEDASLARMQAAPDTRLAR